jgi:hypothetical protein
MPVSCVRIGLCVYIATLVCLAGQHDVFAALDGAFVVYCWLVELLLSKQINKV